MDMYAAAKQWKALRHLIAIVSAMLTRNFGMADIFDYRNLISSSIDFFSGGLHGIRLPSATQGIASNEVMTETVLDRRSSGEHGKGGREHCRYVCVLIASHLLSLLDPFIFPDFLDSSDQNSHLHGLTVS